jgi:radical SAM protein with 4Fe4S-binding SPASM domain
MRTVIFTNAANFNEQKAEAIMRAGLDVLWISFDGYSKEYFERSRQPLQYEHVKNNIELAIAARKKIGAHTKLAIQAVYNPLGNSIINEEVIRFKSYWLRRVDMVNLQRLHSWHGYLKSQVPRCGNIVCKDIFQYLTINWDGSVTPCCVDYEGNLIVGDVRESQLQQIWFGNRFVELRKILLDDVQEIAMCSECTHRFDNSPTPYLNSLIL